MEVQEKKRKLVTVLLAPHGQEEEEDVGSLQVSFSQQAASTTDVPTTSALTGTFST